MALWYSLCQIYKNIFRTLIVTALTAVSFIVLMHSGKIYLRYRECEWNSKGVMKGNLENIYHINFINYIAAGPEEVKALYELYGWIKDSREVKWCGFYDFDHEQKILYAAGGILNMCGIDISCDGKPNAWAGKNRTEDFYRDMAGAKYYVCGRLEEGKSFPDEGYLSAPYLILLDDYIVLDYEYMLGNSLHYIKNGLINNFYFEVGNEFDGDVFVRGLRNKASELGLRVYGINSLDELFELYARNAMEKAGEKYLMPIVLAVCACFAIGICSAQSYEINKRDSKIMLACGMTRRQILMIYAGENLIKIGTGYLLAVAYWISKMRNFKKINTDLRDFHGQYGMLKYSLFACSIVCAVMVLVCSVPVVWKLRKDGLKVSGED